MNIYIFVPYNWAYCDGAIAVVAHSPEEAISTIRKNSERKDYDNHVFYLEKPQPSEDDCYNKWFLAFEAPLVNIYTHPMVVVDDWNYS